MIISYAIPRNGFEADSFIETQVLPLGKALATAIVDNQAGAVVQVNEPGCLVLARAAILVGCGVVDMWELTTVVRSPSGTLVGDLKPGSVEFALSLNGSPDWLVKVHFLEIPDERRPLNLTWRKNSRMKVVYEDDYFSIMGSSSALLSLADHLALLASPKIPFRRVLRYFPGKDLEPSSLPLSIKKVALSSADTQADGNKSS